MEEQLKKQHQFFQETSTTLLNELEKKANLNNLKFGFTVGQPSNDLLSVKTAESLGPQNVTKIEASFQKGAL